MPSPIAVALPLLLAAGDATPHGWLALFGRLHLVVLHFPIALLVTALGIDLARARGRAGAPSDGVATMVWIGAATAVVASAMGLAYADQDEVHTALIRLHRNLALVATGVALLAAGLAWHARRAPSAARCWAFRAALAVAVGLVAFAAHHGGDSVHGDGYLFEAMPGHAPASTPDATAPAER